MRFAHFSALGLVALLAGCGSSQPTEPRWSPYARVAPRDENYHGGSNALLLKYDTNHDGTLTREELVAGLKAEFARLDTKHTGCLSPDQVDEINQARIAADQSAATPIQDWNQDGCVDYREYSAAAYSLFDQIDRNGDGTNHGVGRDVVIREMKEAGYKLLQQEDYKKDGMDYFLVFAAE